MCTLSWKTQAWLDLLWTSLGCVGKAFTPEPQRRVDDWNLADFLPRNWAWIPESFSHKSSMDANIVTGIYTDPVCHQCVTESMWETKAVLQDNWCYLSVTDVFSKYFELEFIFSLSIYIYIFIYFYLILLCFSNKHFAFFPLYSFFCLFFSLFVH